MTLTGSGFGDTQGNGFVALWNSHQVPVVEWSDTQIVVTVPQGTFSGMAFVNQNGAWSNGVRFSVVGAATALGSTPLNFGDVAPGSSGSLSEVLTNNGTNPIRIFWAYATSGFAFSGLSLPVDLDPSQSITFPVTFTPNGAGAVTGVLRVFSNAGFGPVSIPLSGEGQGATVSGALTVNPPTLDFGSVTLGGSKSLNGSLTASGGAVVISSVAGPSGGFTLSGISFPLTLQAGQSAAFSIDFTPQQSGAANGQLSFVSDAAGSAAMETLTGAGAEVVGHNVHLSWTASSSDVAGYNVYRGTQTGGPYAKVSSSVDPNTTYLDGGVAGSQTYYYVVTAVDATGIESENSSEAQAVVPAP